MDSLNSILGRKDFDEPPEVTNIKKYVQDEFKVAVTVMARERDIIITVPSAALASTLRLRSPELKRRCAINDKKIIIRIG
ncbi:MAG: hypothetical protein JWO41_86 [Candidatus Saccharibacteria bacterium]|nr:hypothetical protein [Candidatus Saccharibacteria bacterium]